MLKLKTLLCFILEGMDKEGIFSFNLKGLFGKITFPTYITLKDRILQASSFIYKILVE